MAEPVPAGSDASAGTYVCTSCGYELDLYSSRHLPGCPGCGNERWYPKSTEARQDPNPD